jgi:glycosyltransferase involved in cell wall biosynthesis
MNNPTNLAKDFLRTDKKLISIVVPVRNEELNILPFYTEVVSIFERCSQKYDFELLFTDNHSNDKTFNLLQELCREDVRVRVLRYSRNFGYQKSILTGYLHANGEAIIQLDCDLQDPPEMIINFLNAWEQGNKVVYGVRRSRADNFILHMFRRLFYRFVAYLSEDELPLDAGDFRLIDRRIVDVLRLTDDAQPYLRGTIAAAGFRQLGIPYDRLDRQRGSTNFNFMQLCSLALDGILNHSIIPLRIASFFGIFISILMILLMVGYGIGKIFFQLAWPSGFTTIVVLMLFGISINALFLGIIGEYLGRIYQQVKKKPLTIIEAELGSGWNTKNIMGK